MKHVWIVDAAREFEVFASETAAINSVSKAHADKKVQLIRQREGLVFVIVTDKGRSREFIITKHEVQGDAE